MKRQPTDTHADKTGFTFTKAAFYTPVKKGHACIIKDKTGVFLALWRALFGQ